MNAGLQSEQTNGRDKEAITLLQPQLVSAGKLNDQVGQNKRAPTVQLPHGPASDLPLNTFITQVGTQNNKTVRGRGGESPTTVIKFWRM